MTRISFYDALELSRKLRSENRKATEIRYALANMYENHPAKAVAHVNGKLDEASRGEERRYNFLAAIAD